MVVVTVSPSSSSLHINLRHLSSIASNSSVVPLLHLHHISRSSSRSRRSASGNGVLVVKAYMEDSNSMASFAGKVIGSLPLIGLVARIFNDEGGLGGDIIDFAEFRRRVGKKCSVMDSRAFYEFQDRRGRAGDTLYVLLCCWLAAVGAGLLKSEEILEGVARLRISNDIEFEEENFISIMNAARERRAKLKVATPSIPMDIRAEKALDAIYVCCFGKDPIEEEDERLLSIMLNAVFPSVGQSDIDRIVQAKTKKIAEGGEDESFPEPKSLSEEAVRLQMKDLEFLKQNSET
ncbi:photosystem I assembly factor PSA3, chloroplastic [Macadamia integrifolia]|uniref:photosystem I assembly factor PSA3, chloroplastic n=1 Tax=Macadamia integrifolia TaxID=60698 RepID=UPI001C4FD19E|nr:photosystem I assembly factor PSA3, chloroplastic [Macadamia integrifolia]